MRRNRLRDFLNAEEIVLAKMKIEKLKAIGLESYIQLARWLIADFGEDRRLKLIFNEIFFCCNFWKNDIPTGTVPRFWASWALFETIIREDLMEISQLSPRV